jgi:hypothetical protein
MSKDDLEAVTPIITDMASEVNESFTKEEDIMVTDGWKLDMMGLQRYVNIFIMGRWFAAVISYIIQKENRKVLITHPLYLTVL